MQFQVSDNVGTYFGTILMFSQFELFAKIPVMSCASIIAICTHIIFTSTISRLNIIIGVSCILLIILREFVKPFCYPNWYYLYFPNNIPVFFNNLNTKYYYNIFYRLTIYHTTKFERNNSSLVFCIFIMSHFFEFIIVCWFLS